MKRILVIDDDPESRDVVSEILTLHGFDVVAASDGMQGLGRFLEFAPDLVITDLIMPGREGIETIVSLRRRDPRVRIIAMSGGGVRSARDYLTVAQLVGARRVLAKPFSSDELLTVVNDLLPEAELRPA